MSSSMYGATGVTPLKNTGYNQISMPNKTPQQMDLFNIGSDALKQGMPGILQQLQQMGAGGSPEMWEQLEAPAMRQFGQLQGNVASRFSGMGMGSRKSSGFQNTMGAAAGDLAERLQANRLGLQQGAQDRLMQLYQNLMGQDLNTNMLTPKQKPWWQELLTGLSGVAGQAGGMFGGMGLSKAAGLF